ncbi:MAG: TetR/AcrR family transcriptional regulator [Gammaproteobacteria bacterium]|nr:TetR/AcrR family transcriptional regulator [Gammaproteobacteria bacterium]
MAYRETEKVRSRKDAVRRRILEAVRGRLAAGGFSAATMSRLARDAGIATGTLYRYFPDRAELFAEAFRVYTQREVDNFVQAAAAGASCAGRLANAVRSFAERAIEGHRFAYAMLAEPTEPEVEEQRLLYRRAYTRELHKLLREGMRAGEFAEQDAQVAAAGIVGAIGEALIGPLSPPARAGVDGRLAPRERARLIQSIVQFCLRAAGARETAA